MLHFSSDNKLMKAFVDTEWGKALSSYDLIDKRSLNLIRKNVIPQINSQIATLDIYPYYPENNQEYEMMEKLPMFDTFYRKNKYLRDSIPEISNKYETTLNEINKVFDYFKNKYKIHIDEYIVIHISESYFGPDGHYLRKFPTIYRDKNR